MHFTELILGLGLGTVLGFLISWARSLKSESDAKARLAAREVELAELKRRMAEESGLTEQVEKRFSDAFKNLSREILVNQGAHLLKQNQANIEGVLSPLKERIKEFQDKVERSHREAGERAAGLAERLKSLESLGLQMSEEADRLTRALKGENKVQGNWGEVILERILEDSGLRKGKEYFTQGSGLEVQDDDGKRIRPDVVVRLPENKHLVIDSKVSLQSYEAFIAAQSDEERKTHSRSLLKSIRNHVDGLSQKHYQTSKGVNSPDFVIMFMPIEATFSVALAEDGSLFQYAWDKRIMIVTPTTLMATLWTISSMWRQENQTRFAYQIAEESGKLYDKFVGFLSSFQEIGKSIDKSREAYDKALNQMKTGRGNLIQRAEKIRKMGARSSRKLSETSLADGTEELE